MIIANEKTDVQSGGIGETSRATIKASARLFNFFSDMIYSDKFVAIWRELVANGMDAQTAAGNPQQQMIVTLPTDYTPYAKVRDFGTGMSHDFLMGKFMAYTDASTKENSNDFIGGFGIGSKAPLAYTEQFAIHSYQNGEVGIYSIFKDETGCPSIAFLAKHPTTEPDGVEISFPVEGGDIKAFREAVHKTLNYFDPAPVLVNSEQQLFKPEYTVRTASWGFLKGANTSRIVQGGIAYPLDPGHDKTLDELLGFGIDFYVPIGSCSIALSRERLSYDDRTIRILKSLADSIKPDLEQHIGAIFSNCKTLWEAKALYSTETQTGNPARTRLVQQFAKFKGQALSAYIRPTNAMQSKVLAGFITSARYSKAGYHAWTESRRTPNIRSFMYDVYPKDISIVLIDDGPKKPVLRMRRYLEENDIGNKGVMILRPKPDVEMSAMDWGRLLVQLGRPPVIKLSEIEPAVVTRTPGVARVQKVRAYNHTSFYTPGPTSKFVDTVPPTGGYYMYMESFNVVDVDGKPQATRQELQASGLKPEEIFWFNKGDFAAIKGNPLWVPAKVAYDKRMATYAKDHKNMALASAFANLISNYEMGRWVAFVRNSNLNMPKRGPLAQLQALYKSIEADLTDQDRVMRGLINVSFGKESVMLNNLVNDIVKKYPELSLLVHGRNGSVSDRLVPVYNKLF